MHSGEGRQTIGSECVYFLLGSVCADAASALGRSNQLGIALGFVLSLSRSLPPSFSLSLFLSLPLSLSSSPYLSLSRFSSLPFCRRSQMEYTESLNLGFSELNHGKDQSRLSRASVVQCIWMFNLFSHNPSLSFSGTPQPSREWAERRDGGYIAAVEQARRSTN